MCAPRYDDGDIRTLADFPITRKWPARHPARLQLD
jgi:hypothetical protein